MTYPHFHRMPGSGDPLETSRASAGQSRRRGVLLIVVLSLLTLFMLLGTTYIVLASRDRTVSRAYLQLADEQSRSTTSLRPLLREAAMQVIRGTTKTGSGLRYHDLLRDRYGIGCSPRYGIDRIHQIAPNSNDCQLLGIDVRGDLGQCTGRVLTFLTGPAEMRGLSTRVCDSYVYDDNTQTPAVRKTRLTIIRPSALTSVSALTAGTEIAINDIEFNGNQPGPSPLEISRARRPYLDLPNWSGVLQNPPAGTDD